MTFIRVKPAPGKLVRDPVTYRHLALEGEDKPRNQYWIRRLQEGSVVMVRDQTPSKETESCR
jgi:Protein of unknown function (DUF2635)